MLKKQLILNNRYKNSNMNNLRKSFYKIMKDKILKILFISKEILKLVEIIILIKKRLTTLIKKKR